VSEKGESKKMGAKRWGEKCKGRKMRRESFGQDNAETEF
jgi:hypothetical protein